ncbi:5ef9aaaf-831c-412e-89e5-73800c3981c6 [Sclerotinia trifoliorum]|uniref:5ef9aaaf-831c-412e-89e5-73800c3981c6 n=1 Tax=Sclerotinia trifoliorum TaxID=28548 RepID=A0A8H2ZUQ3_9HELO|nr:5ef9aaaf-831c-412e-89e5-73800c3981c6 [Sclerotinia trifoliorum]
MSTKDKSREITTGIDKDLSATHMLLQTKCVTSGCIKPSSKFIYCTTITADNEKGAMYARDHPVSTHRATSRRDEMPPQDTRTTADKIRDTSGVVRVKTINTTTRKAKGGSMVRMRTIESRLSRNVEERKREGGERGGSTNRGKEEDAWKRRRM